MELTPIKIPGKNTRDNSKAAKESRKAVKRPRGRPLKPLPPASHLSPSKQIPDQKTSTGKEKKERSLKNIKSRRKMSHLEKLPTELLHKIFWYCENLGLPRSSPIIESKLSGEIIWGPLIVKAFGPTWGGSEADGDSCLQSAILRCRWANLKLIFKALKAFRARGTWGREGQSAPGLYWNGFQLDPERRHASFMKYDYQACFDKDFRQFSEWADSYTRKSVGARNYPYIDRSIFQRVYQNSDVGTSCIWANSVNLATEIPSPLLLGPWNEESTKYLFWLVNGGAHVDWLISTTGELADTGIRKAIVLGDNRVTHLLALAMARKENINLLVDLAILSLRNAGGHRLSIINGLLDTPCRFGAKARDRLVDAVKEFKEEARAEQDQEKRELANELGAIIMFCTRDWYRY